jgi:thymidylate synthase (FAD)
MKIIEPSAEIIRGLEDYSAVLARIEAAGRTCYKSEDKITPVSAAAFVKRIIDSGHHSVLEHESVTVRIICDRGVSHELVRHRLASFSQESTRYANYLQARFGSELTFIKPCFWDVGSLEYVLWFKAMERAEGAYLDLTDMGVSAQEARSVLPNSLKTEIVITCNIREWRHIFELRCAKAAHPQMREIMLPLLREMHEKAPILFEDLIHLVRG